MMNCDKARLLLVDYIDGNLEPLTKKELDEHLEIHVECKKIFDDAKIIQQRINNLPAIHTSPDFDIKLREKIIDFNNGNNREILSVRKSFSLGISGAVLVIALIFYMYTDFGVQPNTTEPVLPSSTISSSANEETNSINQETQPALGESEKVADDSLKNIPEKIDNSAIHLTGKQR